MIQVEIERVEFDALRNLWVGEGRARKDNHPGSGIAKVRLDEGLAQAIATKLLTGSSYPHQAPEADLLAAFYISDG